MKVLKKLLIVMLIFLILFPILPTHFSHAETYTGEQIGEAIARVAKKIVIEGNDDIRGKVLRYSQRHRQSSGYNWKLVTDSLPATTDGGKEGEIITGKLAFDCSSFASYVYTHTTAGTVKFINRSSEFASNSYLERHDISEAKPGDILWKSGHVAICVGENETAEAVGMFKDGDKKRNEDEQVVIGKITGREDPFVCVYRLNQKAINQVTQIDESVNWNELGLSNVGSEGFYYNGLAKRSQAIKATPFHFYDMLTDLSDYIIGSILFMVKVELIGWTAIFENLISGLVYIGTGDTGVDNQKITIEKIIYNKIPILDINFFNLSTNNPETDVVYMIRSGLAGVYSTFRAIAIIGLLIVLIYIGIRMAISTIASEKAKYQQLFINWLVSFIIVFFIHFFMLAVILINQSFVNVLAKNAAEGEQTITEMKLVDAVDEYGNPIKKLESVTSTVTVENSLYNSILTKAYDLKASQGMTGTIMYMFLVYYLVKFLIIYFKRLLSVNILAIISPLIAISYAIDKIKDNKSQSLGRWAKDFSINVFMQLIHGLLYLLFVKIAFDIAFHYSLTGIIMAFVFLNFMLKAEKLILSMFGMGSNSSSFKAAVDATTGVYITTMGVIKGGKTLGNLTVKGAGAVKTKVNNTVDAFADSSLGSRIASSRFYGGTLGRVSNRLYAHGNDFSKIAKMKKDREKLREERSKAIKGTWGAISDTVKAGTEFALSVPRMVVSPKLGLTKGLNARNKLASMYANSNSITVSREKGLAYRGANRLLWTMTLGAATLEGISQMNENREREAQKVEERKAKIKQNAEAYTKEMKKKIKEKVMEEAREDIRKGRAPKITYGQVAQAKQVVLAQLGIKELQFGEFDGMIGELSKGLEDNAVIDKKEFNNAVCKELEQALDGIVVEIDNEAKGITPKEKNQPDKPTNEQINETLEKSPEKEMIGIIIRSLKRVKRDADEHSIIKQIEEYKKRNHISGEIELRDIERIVREIGGEKSGEKEVRSVINQEKKATYLDLKVKSSKESKQVEGQSYLSLETTEKIKEDIRPVVSEKVEKIMNEAREKIVSEGNSRGTNEPLQGYTREEKQNMMGIAWQNMSGEEISHMITQAANKSKSIKRK